MTLRRLPTIVLMIAMSIAASAASAQTGGQTGGGQQAPEVLRECSKRAFEMRTYGEGGSQGQPAEAGKWRATGNVVMYCDDIVIYADEVEWSEKDQIVHARGRVTFEQPTVRITAARMELNNTTKMGVFHGADGVAEITRRANEPRSLFGTQEPEVHFWAERLERIGEQRYEIEHGGFTTCMQPTERWTISGRSLTVVLDEYVLLRNAIFRVKNVPLFFLPFMYYPLGEDDRSSGFLLPTYTSSSALGTGLSNAFFWAISRSQDATLYHTWYSRAGQSFGGEYRYSSAPGSDGFISTTILNTPAAAGIAGSREFKLNGHVNQGLPRGFRLIGRANYFSNIRVQQDYEQNLIDLSQRRRDFDVTLSGAIGRARLDATVQQFDFFQDFDTVNRSGRAPSIRLTLPDRPIGRSRVYVGAAGDAIYFVRHDDIADPSTNFSLWRFDAQPTIRAPLSNWPFLSVSATAAWRLTHWLERRDTSSPITVQVPQSISRQLFDLKADVTGPTFSRVFTPSPSNGYAERFKHLIEPRFSVQWLSPFDRRAEVVQIDYIDQLVGGTTTVSYSLTNRVLARRKRAGGLSDVREILSVGLSQSYYTNAAAAAADPNYVSQTAQPFGPIVLSVIANPGDTVRADFRTDIDAEFRRPREFRASTTIVRGMTQLSGSWSKRQFIPGLPFYDSAASATHFFNAAAALSDRDRRLGGRYELYYNLKLRSFVQDRMLVFFNSQCCGVAIDYTNTRAGIGAGAFLPRSNRTFNITFTLAGIGSFANPFGAFGNNAPR